MRFSRLAALAVLFGVSQVSGDGPAAVPFRVFAQPPATGVILSQRLGPSTRAGDVALAVMVKNISTQKQTFLTMTCSWWDDWFTDSDLVKVRTGMCDKNVPLLVNLKPGQTYERQLPLTVQSRKRDGTVVFKVAVRAKDGASLSVNDLVSMLSAPKKHARRTKSAPAYWSDSISLPLLTPEK